MKTKEILVNGKPETLDVFPSIGVIWIGNVRIEVKRTKIEISHYSNNDSLKQTDTYER